MCTVTALFTNESFLTEDSFEYIFFVLFFYFVLTALKQWIQQYRRRLKLGLGLLKLDMRPRR